MTDQTSPATALPSESLIARLRAFRGPYLGDGVHTGIHRDELIAALSQAPAQATIDVLRAEVERLRGTLTMLRNHTAVSENQLLMIDDALHRLTDSAPPCAGTNCGATTGPHGAECIAEHARAVAGIPRDEK